MRCLLTRVPDADADFVLVTETTPHPDPSDWIPPTDASRACLDIADAGITQQCDIHIDLKG